MTITELIDSSDRLVLILERIECVSSECRAIDRQIDAGHCSDRLERRLDHLHCRIDALESLAATEPAHVYWLRSKVQQGKP